MNRRAVEGAGNDTGQTDQSVPSVGTFLPDHAHLTIYDVARAAGVAPSTVSRALSKPGRVSYKTAEHVRQVAERARLRHRPDRADGVRTRQRHAGHPGGRHRQPGVLRDDPGSRARGARPRLHRAAAGDPGDGARPSGRAGPADPGGGRGDPQRVANVRRRDPCGREAEPPCCSTGWSARCPRWSATTCTRSRKPASISPRSVTPRSAISPDRRRPGPTASGGAGCWRLALELDLHVHRLGPFLPTMRGGAAAAEQWLPDRRRR